MCERVFVCFRHSSRASCYRRLRERLGHAWCHAWLEFGDCEPEPGVCAFVLSGEPALRVLRVSLARSTSPAAGLVHPMDWGALGGARSAQEVLSRLRGAGVLSLDPHRLLTCTELREAVAGSPLFEPLAREDTGEWGMEYV